jgi:hypothetical protein
MFGSDEVDVVAAIALECQHHGGYLVRGGFLSRRSRSHSLADIKILAKHAAKIAVR